MAYMALRRLYMGTDEKGNEVWREEGELVPEADEWNWMGVRAWVNEGFIRRMDIVEPAPKQTRAKKEAADASSA